MTKLLACDFDYTLYTKEDYYKNIEAVNKFVELGNIFVIVTGRFVGFLLDDIKDRNINYNYLICNDGSVILNKDLNIIYEKYIPKEIVKPIIDMFENSPHIQYWYIDEGFILSRNINKEAAGLIGRINDNNAKELLDEILNKYDDVNGYVSNNWVNITEKSVNKGNSIEILRNKLNIDKKDVYTIGNDTNDIPMSNYNSYCMKGSKEELRKICIKEYNSVYELIEDITK
jgi:HAD superfamily hydrolase (TIGR01484 family)